MAWPAEAGSLGMIAAPSRRKREAAPVRSQVMCAPAPVYQPAVVHAPRRTPRSEPVRSRMFDFAGRRGKHYGEARGLHRVFNAALYRFYRDNSAPPAESDSPFDTNATLPYTPTDVYADGTWYLSMSRFNGVLDSGFLPLGQAGETYLRLELSGGGEQGNPPAAPQEARVEAVAGGVVRVRGGYFQTGSDRADQWAIAYTFDGGAPATDTPDATQDLDGEFVMSLLQHDLTAQSHGTTVKARVQVRRNDGTAESPVWVYSEGSTVLTITADATGPTTPTSGDSWPGQLPATE